MITAPIKLFIFSILKEEEATFCPVGMAVAVTLKAVRSGLGLGRLRNQGSKEKRGLLPHLHLHHLPTAVQRLASHPATNANRAHHPRAHRSRRGKNLLIKQFCIVFFFRFIYIIQRQFILSL
jgi:hypothetical protein